MNSDEIWNYSFFLFNPSINKVKKKKLIFFLKLSKKNKKIA